MHKVAIDLGFRAIHWYGILVAVGFLVGLWTASRRGVRDGLPREAILDLGLWLILGGIVGARAWFVASYWKEFFAAEPIWEVFMIQRGGLVYYGGLLGATLASVAWLLHQGIPLWKAADALAPSIALGHIFGRIGCLMNGCCYGSPTHLPWAIHFPPHHATGGAGVHPTQIYESILNLALFAGLAGWHRHRKFEGQIFAAYLILYAALRFAVENFRGDYHFRHFGGLLTPGQLASPAVFLAGIVLYFLLHQSGNQSGKKANLHPRRSCPVGNKS